MMEVAYVKAIKVESKAADMLFEDHFLATSGGLQWSDTPEDIREFYRIKARRALGYMDESEEKSLLDRLVMDLYPNIDHLPWR